jgi:hypothetical protein
MKALWLGLLLAGLTQGSDLELDCARPNAASALIGQARLSDIEWAEDVNREAMWEAFGRCPPGPGAPACREQHRRDFETALERQKAAIREKYRKILRDFLEGCLASIV